MTPTTIARQQALAYLAAMNGDWPDPSAIADRLWDEAEPMLDDHLERVGWVSRASRESIIGAARATWETELNRIADAFGRAVSPPTPTPGYPLKQCGQCGSTDVDVKVAAWFRTTEPTELAPSGVDWDGNRDYHCNDCNHEVGVDDYDELDQLSRALNHTTVAGWAVAFEYPGFVQLSRDDRDFTIEASPGWDGDSAITVQVTDLDGGELYNTTIEVGWATGDLDRMREQWTEAITAALPALSAVHSCDVCDTLVHETEAVGRGDTYRCPDHLDAPAGGAA